MIEVNGEEGQFEAVIDTGSSTFWINSELCALPICKTRKRIKATANKTSNLIQVCYGEGEVSGIVIPRKIVLADHLIDNVKVLAVHEISHHIFKGGYYDAVVGLSPMRRNLQNITTLAGSMIKQNTLKENKMALLLQRKPAQGFARFGNLGYLSLGYDISYFDNQSDRYWEIQLDDILVDGRSIGLCDSNCSAIFDSGTSLILGERPKVMELLSFLNISNDCSNLDSAPPITFLFGNQGYTVESSDYVLGLRETSNYELYSSKMARKCLPGFATSKVHDHGSNTWILGNLFLSKYLLVFDWDKRSIGIGLPPPQYVLN